ncbi:segregation/condensation protein A [bacterium]|nr:segregation/condensation protein A [bacterium]
MNEPESNTFNDLPADPSLAEVARAAGGPPAPPSEEERPKSALSPYTIRLDEFEGPLDLLLFLVRKNSLDIFKVSIASIADQFCAIIAAMQKLDLDVAGEFLVVAGTLVRMKSRALLPSPTEDEGEEEVDPGVALERLKEYQVFKEVAGILRTKEADMADLYAREKPPRELAELREEEVEYIEVDIYALYNAFKKVMADLGPGPGLEIPVIEDEDYTVDEKIEELRLFLLRQSHLVLSEYLARLRSKLEIIVTFLAILEMMRLRLVSARQPAAGGEIRLVRLERLLRWNGGLDAETELES